MKSRFVATVLLLALACSSVFAEPVDIDKELTTLADKLSSLIKEQGKKKVTVLDFTDLQGGSSELGRYIAEQVTVNLVMNKHDFSVMDRANLKSILAEHKLTAQGLVDPDNAKKLGMFAGVDALIVGNIIPKDESVSLTVKIITTDTAEIVGAARGVFKTNAIVKQFESHPSSGNKGGTSGDTAADETKISKTYGDLRAEFSPLKIVNGTELQLTVTLTNLNAKKSLWVALHSDNGARIKGVVTDSNGSEFHPHWSAISGISYAVYEKDPYRQDTFTPSTEIQPNDSTTATIKFMTLAGNRPQPGSCNLQLELLVGHDFGGNRGAVSVHNFVGSVTAN